MKVLHRKKILVSIAAQPKRLTPIDDNAAVAGAAGRQVVAVGAGARGGRRRCVRVRAGVGAAGLGARRCGRAGTATGLYDGLLAATAVVAVAPHAVPGVVRRPRAEARGVADQHGLDPEDGPAASGSTAIRIAGGFAAPVA